MVLIRRELSDTGREVWINPDHIVLVIDYDLYTDVHLTGKNDWNKVSVRGTAQELLDLIPSDWLTRNR